MKIEIDALDQSFSSALTHADNLKSIEKLRIDYFGKKGSITQALHKLGELPAKERPEWGQKINRLKSDLETKLEKKKKMAEMLLKLDLEEPTKETIRLLLGPWIKIDKNIEPLLERITELMKIKGITQYKPGTSAHEGDRKSVV